MSNRFSVLVLSLIITFCGTHNAHAMASARWKSIQPFQLKIPIFDISLKTSGGTIKNLYHCASTLPDNCLVDVTSGSDPNAALIQTAISSILPGTYTQSIFNYCPSGATSYSAKVAASALIGGGMKLATTSTGVTEDDNAVPVLTSVNFPGCSHTYTFPSAITVSSGDLKKLQILFDLKDMGWMARGNSTTQSAWASSGCTGTYSSAATSPFLCLTPPDLGGILDSKELFEERYNLSAHASLGIFYNSLDQPVWAFTRRHYSDEIAYNPIFDPEKPIKALQKNTNGTLTIENFGNTATDHGSFRAEAFQRTGHNGTFTDAASAPQSYSCSLRPGSGNSAMGLPTCASGATPFTQIPISSTNPAEYTLLQYLEPIGFLSAPAHTYPTVHAYLHFTKVQPTDLVDLYAPGNIRITSVRSTSYLQSNIRQGKTDYTINFSPCQNIDSKFGHLESLQGPLIPLYSALNYTDCTEYDTAPDSETANEHVRACVASVSIDVPAITSGVKTFIAKASGPTADGLDWGVQDNRISNSFRKPSRYPNALHAACPSNYFTPSPKATLEAALGIKAGSGVLPVSFSPKCGTVSVDYPVSIASGSPSETLQGMWVQNGSPSEGPVNESMQLVLAPHYGRADVQSLSIGTGLTDVLAGTYYFHWLSSGYVNRQFGSITDHSIYCYEASAVPGAIDTPTFDTSFLVRKNIGDTSLTIEGTGNTGCGAAPSSWVFGPKAKIYIR